MATKGTIMETHSNLQSFLSSTTPVVKYLSIPKIVGILCAIRSASYARDINTKWQPADKDKVEFYYLEHLWLQYSEWSAYGLGVPLRLRNGKSVTQYYTPYLSAIQLFTTKALSAPSKIHAKKAAEGKERASQNKLCSKNAGEGGSVGASFSGAISEGEKFFKSSVSASDSAGSWLTQEQEGYLYFEYVEIACPHDRLPLFDKVQQFAGDYPGLIKFRSADLSPASWMSVAWYPIYQIPSQRTHEFSACFLTYHTLSSSFQDHIARDEAESDTESRKSSLKYHIPRDEEDSSESGKNCPKFMKVGNDFSLPSFGLATLKLHGNLFVNPKAGDPEKYRLLYSAAGSWLKQVGFDHRDYNYFRSRC